MSAIDLSACAGRLIVLLLAVRFGALVQMRDRDHVAPHLVSRLVWCPRHERTVWVNFTERVWTGMAYRTVRNCPLRTENARCDECTWEPALSSPVPRV